MSLLNEQTHPAMPRRRRERIEPAAQRTRVNRNRAPGEPRKSQEPNAQQQYAANRAGDEMRDIASVFHRDVLFPELCV